MILCKELNKEFDTKQDLVSALRLQYKEIIAAKKAQIYKSCEKGIAVHAKPLDYLKLSTQTKGLALDENYYYIAVNSTKILDSHLDLHLDGLWNKTVKEQQGRNYLVADHKLELDKTIVKREYVEMFTATIPFSMIGKSYDGNTEVLVYKVKKDKVINPVAKEWLESGDSIEASVRMQYVDILFAVNSDDKEDVKFKDNYDKYIGGIANIDDFDTEIVYFWIIKQAKNIFESSLVLFGSNSSTGTITVNEEKTNVVCQECKNEFDYLSIPEKGMGYVECPECKAVVTQEMKMQPPTDTASKIDQPPKQGTEKEQKEFYLSLLKN